MNVICFDLDDTLYKEVDYLYAAYICIARKLWGGEWQKWYGQMREWYESGENVFDNICGLRRDVKKTELLEIYRYSVFPLLLSSEVENTLSKLKTAGVKLGLITDGRVRTQKNKIRALGLDGFFEEEMIVISESFGSEKPDERNYKYFMNRFPDCSCFVYVGDNPQKDFIAPNVLGWDTICLLDDGHNIHKQDFGLPAEYLPKSKIDNIGSLFKMFAKNDYLMEIK